MWRGPYILLDNQLTYFLSFKSTNDIERDKYGTRPEHINRGR